jgi:hypothetical protein
MRRAKVLAKGATNFPKPNHSRKSEHHNLNYGKPGAVTQQQRGSPGRAAAAGTRGDLADGSIQAF